LTSITRGYLDDPKTEAGFGTPVPTAVLDLIRVEGVSKRIEPTDFSFGTPEGGPGKRNNVLRPLVYPACDAAAMSASQLVNVLKNVVFTPRRPRSIPMKDFDSRFYGTSDATRPLRTFGLRVYNLRGPAGTSGITAA
jgi:hypothetical protein